MARRPPGNKPKTEIIIAGNSQARSGPPHRARRSASAVAAELRCREAAVPYDFLDIDSQYARNLTIRVEQNALRGFEERYRHCCKHRHHAGVCINDLSEDVRKDIDSLYLAIGQLAEKLEEKKMKRMPRIGFI